VPHRWNPMRRRYARVDPTVGAPTAAPDDQAQFVEREPVPVDIAGLMPADDLLPAAMHALDQQPRPLLDKDMEQRPAVRYQSIGGSGLLSSPNAPDALRLSPGILRQHPSEQVAWSITPISPTGLIEACERRPRIPLGPSFQTAPPTASAAVAESGSSRQITLLGNLTAIFHFPPSQESQLRHLRLCR